MTKDRWTQDAKKDQRKQKIGGGQYDLSEITNINILLHFMLSIIPSAFSQPDEFFPVDIVSVKKVYYRKKGKDLHYKKTRDQAYSSAKYGDDDTCNQLIVTNSANDLHMIGIHVLIPYFHRLTVMKAISDNYGRTILLKSYDHRAFVELVDRFSVHDHPKTKKIQ